MKNGFCFLILWVCEWVGEGGVLVKGGVGWCECNCECELRDRGWMSETVKKERRLLLLESSVVGKGRHRG